MVTPVEITQIRNLGRCIIPSGVGETKKQPAIAWQEYQKRLPTPEELAAWYNKKPTLWGIVTGEISGIVVFDADTVESAQVMHDAGLTPHVKTKRGEHFYFKHPGHPMKNSASKLMPGLDFRGDGGFVNCMGKNDNAEYTILKLPTNESLYTLTQLPETVKAALLAQPTKTILPVASGVKDIADGYRDQQLTVIAGTLRNQGLERESLFLALKTINQQRCDPPLDDPQVQKIADSISKKPMHAPPNGYVAINNIRKDVISFSKGVGGDSFCDTLDTNEATGVTNSSQTGENSHNPSQVSQTVTEHHKVTRQSIRALLTLSGGRWISMNDIDRELFILSPEERAIRRNEVYDELKSGLLERHPSNANLVRCVNTVSEKLVISQDTITPPLPLWMPLGLHQLCDLRQKNIMHVAGRSNAGKTPFLLQMALANSHIMPTVYFSSEMDSAELSLRISLFKNGFEVWDKIDFQLRSRDFADVIRPEWANYIDYIELPADQSFIIGDILTGIHNRLTKGYAVVASQKKDGTDFGRGGEYGLEKPRIYLSMNLDTVKIIKGKWRHDPRIDPNYRECRYHTLGGALLNRDTPWTKEGEIPFMPKNEKLPKCFEMAKQEFLKDDDFALP